MDLRKILVVEDQEDQLDLFRLFLESLGYSHILLARNGIEALRILEAQNGEIELMLLNWAMPHMDGITLLRHLAGSYRPMLGVIMESGYPDADYIRQFFRLGTETLLPIDYLVKPFSLDEFGLEIAVAMEYLRQERLRR